jgi:hypothetical protein
MLVPVVQTLAPIAKSGGTLVLSFYLFCSPEKKNLKLIEQLEEQKKRLRGQLPGGPVGQPPASADK